MRRRSAGVAPVDAESPVGGDAAGGRGVQQDGKALGLFLVGALLAMPMVMGSIVWMTIGREGLQKTFERPQKHRGLTIGEVHAHLSNHTLLHIGALHRSGASLVQDGLERHPGVSRQSHKAHTDPRVKHDTALHRHEGFALQHVYPRFGLDHARGHNFIRSIKQYLGYVPLLGRLASVLHVPKQGVGEYALDPANHLDESTPLLHKHSQVQLFNEWALFWELERPVLMEKSPTNIAISPFLHRLWGLGVAKSPGRFIFIRRHPIATAMSTRRAGDRATSHLSIRDLVEHWLVAEERLEADLRNYFEMGAGSERARGSTFRVIPLETIVESPRAVFSDLVRWLGLEPNAAAVHAFVDDVRADPNGRYFRHYCHAMMSPKSNRSLQMHASMTADLNSRVMALEPKYDLQALPAMCRRTLVDGKPPVEPPSELEEARQEGLEEP